jgi:hypothetical protein
MEPEEASFVEDPVPVKKSQKKNILLTLFK